TEIYEENALKYLKDPWEARNNYIDVVLDRNSFSVKQFCQKEEKQHLSKDERIEVIKLLEIQRQAMLMYTSCGWFFNELSGIETVQIIKYAARAIQIAAEFSGKNLEEPFLEILNRAKSNLPEHGSGKDIYLKWVKPSIVSTRQIVSHWAISSLFEDYEDETDLFSYNIKSQDYKKTVRGNSALVVGKINVTSKVTLEERDIIFILLHFGGEDFHCAIKGFAGNTEYFQLKEEVFNQFDNKSLTEVIRTIDKYFGKEYFTLKDLFLEERRKVINILIQDKMEKFSQAYQALYDEAKGPMLELQKLGLQIPSEFKIVAEYTLSHSFNTLFLDIADIRDDDIIINANNINDEAKKLNIEINKTSAINIFSNLITKNIKKIERNMEIHDVIDSINILNNAGKLDLKLKLVEAQNIYFASIHRGFPELLENLKTTENPEEDKKFISKLLILGNKLNINVEGYEKEFNLIKK
ncbi:MAG: DUF3536 domain-containing protein, partial [Candidatus Gastranaerophilales bacterium]|nr:DUF3536 domain-containing protein [Candidatus Gastranaerophilales bacterium]